MDERIKTKVEDRLHSKSVDLIINTHAHVDHCGGNKYFGGKVCIHRDDAKELTSGRFYDTCEFFGEEARTRFDRLLQDRDKIDLGEIVLEVIHTPGHTSGSICLYEKDEKMLFSGDTLFPDGGFGRVDLRGGDLNGMINSLEKLQDYDFEILFPGHMGIVKKAKDHLREAIKNAGGHFHV
jgi:glyoxylase-like metal-dependent hydrolase (beta-lactamase superfamily II)